MNKGKTENIRKKCFVDSDKARKLLVASIVVASATAVADMALDNQAEAAELYLWEKYKINKVYDNKPDAPIVGYMVNNAHQWNGEWWDQITYYDINWNVKQRSELGDTNLGHLYSLIWDSERVDTSVPGEKSYRLTEKLRYYEFERTLVDTVKASMNAYPENTVHSDGFFYVKKGLANTAPTTPTLTVPQKQFEYGDRHIIGWNSTDAENDPITYTLQASYNGGAWETIYTGPNRSFEYVVPNNKGINVKFRVIASDGKLTSTSVESELKSIREVMYYWNKFSSLINVTSAVNVKSTGEHEYNYKGNWQNPGPYMDYADIWYFEIDNYIKDPFLYPEFQYGTAFTFDENGNIKLTGTIPRNENPLPSGYTFYIYRGKDIYGYDRGFHKYEIIRTTQRSIYYKIDVLEMIKTNNGYKKGALLEQNIQAGLNAYPHDQRNSADGNWYVRGQRVLDEDTTPPIIELTEQQNYGATSSVTVRTHDLGTVQTVKWAQGNHNIAYFASGGTVIATGQNAASSFVATSNGVYTVYAVDNKGNATVQTIEVKKVNTPPTMLSVGAVNKFDVIDASTNFQIRAMATDVDSQKLNLTASYNGKTATAANGVNLELLGANYSKGFYTSPITVSASDGIANSAPITLNDHVVIRVDDAADYTFDLANHTDAADSFTSSQHRAFYDAYEAVRAYETSKTAAQYTAAKSAMTKMATQTGILESDTLSAWNERVDVVYADEMLKAAEASLNKDEYETAFHLHDKLKLKANKDLLQERLDELGRYHIASDELHRLTAFMNDSTLFYQNVGWTEINHAKDLINEVKSSPYLADLNPRLQTIIDYYINNKKALTEDDLKNIGLVIPSDLDSDILNDIKDAFGETIKNAQQLIDVSAALKQVMNNLDKPSIDNFKAVVKTSVQSGVDIDSAKLATIQNAVDTLFEHRTNFVEDDTKVTNSANAIQSLTTGQTFVKNYFDAMNKALKEVSEYNDVEFDEQHNEMEKQEGFISLEGLWDNTQFKNQMRDYLINGIPEISVPVDKYEYIHNGNLKVKGSILDTDSSATNYVPAEVTVEIGGAIATKTSELTGEFEIEVTTAPGLIRDVLKITSDDSLTKKRVIIKDKPVINVTNVELFTEMVKALEIDRSEDFTVMQDATLVELIAIQDILLTVHRDTSPIDIRKLTNRAEALSTQQDGLLEKIVRDYVQSNYLKWLFENYLIATVDDFEFAGVLDNGKLVVTPGNIAAIRVVIADYTHSFISPDEPPVPQVSDYIQWANMIKGLDELDKQIEGIYDLSDLDQVLEEIAIVTEKVASQIPEWSSLMATYQTKIANVLAYKEALSAVIKAEDNVSQIDLDAAQLLVDEVTHVAAQAKLQDRLDTLQAKINAVNDAIKAVENAETIFANGKGPLEDTKKAIEDARLIVAKVSNEDTKTQLNERLDLLEQYITAIEAVLAAEEDTSQITKDTAQSLVDSLPEGALKDELQAKLDLVQDTINQKNAEEKAEDSVKKVETTWDVEDFTAAQDLVSKLVDSNKKDKLESRLDIVENLINHYQNALQAVEVAETTKDTVSVNVAQELIDRLVEAAGATNDKIELLQERLNSVSHFIEAEKAVTKAEKLLTQGSKDLAQQQVNALKNGEEKQKLQERLDKIQELLDKKEVDLIDKIIDNPKEIGSDELAKYIAPEKVYKELIDDYTDGFIDFIEKNDSITKDDVISIVRLINSLEIAKRSMSLTDINLYKQEYQAAVKLAKLPLHKYPTPEFLMAIEAYISDDSVQGDVIAFIVSETGMSEAEVIEAMKKLRGEHEETKFGSYSVQYIDEMGGIVRTDTFNEIEYGEVEIMPILIDGYEFIQTVDDINSFILNDETNGNIFTFNVKKLEATTTTEDSANVEITAGSYTVEYRDSEGQLIYSTIAKDIPFGNITVQADLTIKDLENYILVEGVEPIQNFELTKDTNGQVIIFSVELLDSEQNESKSDDFFDFLDDETVDTEAKQIPVPAIEEDEASTESESDTVIETEAPVEKEILPKHAYSTKRMASVDGIYLTTTTSVPTSAINSLNENNANYLATAFFALDSVKVVSSNTNIVPSDQQEQVKIYIVNNILDGAYKEYLLAQLNVDINNIGNGDDGIPDLTPIDVVKPPVEPPTKPPVEPEKPIEPPVITPPITGGGGTGGGILPTLPIEEDKQEIGKNEVSDNHKDSSYEWTLKNPSGNEFTFKYADIEVTIPINEFPDADTIMVTWEHIGSEHYKLTVLVDGKEITKFKSVVKVTKQHGFAYLVRGFNEDYKAMPYAYKAGKFNFATKDIKEPFYFSTAKRSFGDIHGLYSKDAIEELASRYIVNGTSSNTYSPYQNITRAQFSAMVSRSLGLEPTNGQEISFQDAHSHWASKEIQALYEANIVKGVSENQFNPNGQLTRKQAALMIYRLLKAQGVDLPTTTASFADNDVLMQDNELFEAAGALQSLGIFEGDKGRFNAYEQLTRTQMAKVLYQTLKYTANF